MIWPKKPKARINEFALIHADMEKVFQEQRRVLVELAEAMVEIDKLKETVAELENDCFNRHVKDQHRTDRLRKDIEAIKGTK